MVAHFDALDEGVLLVPFDSRYTQVGFNLVSIQVWGRGNPSLPITFGHLLAIPQGGLPKNDLKYWGGWGLPKK